MDCGDGELDEHEECDDGNTIGSDGCSSTCMYEGPSTPLIAVCGDGIVEDGEMCDDGNTANDDECDSECAVQTRPVVFCLCLCRTFSRTNLCANSNPTNDPDIRCQERGFGPGGARSAQECINGEGMTCQGYSPGTGRRVQGTIRDCMPRVFNQ
jgi:cysteine-rich repeat protein